MIAQVSGDSNLASLVHKRSAGYKELNALMQNSRVPAEALERASADAQARTAPRA